MIRDKGTPTAVAAAPANRHMIESEPGCKITIVMLERHAAYLDLICVLFRRRHQKAIARTAIVRALVEFMQRGGVDYSQFASADAMVVYLVKHFQTVARSRGLASLPELTLFRSVGDKRAAEGGATEPETDASHGADPRNSPR